MRSTNHFAVVLGPPPNAVGAATLGRDSTWNPKRTCATRYEASRSSSISVIMLPLAERCGKVIRDALSTLEIPRAGPSEAAERPRSVGIVLKLQERHSGARSLDYTSNPARLFPCRGEGSHSMSFVSEVSRSERDDNPGESLSERSPGTGFLMRLIGL